MKVEFYDRERIAGWVRTHPASRSFNLQQMREPEDVADLPPF
ncbi:hypothetical protein FHS15_001290 [Paenibacillus castaneae]|nr:hypothetical protein [Paenibacillus castaneae]NIK76183.1 hypothetical protein [Paenibacillus castaneae]